MQSNFSIRRQLSDALPLFAVVTGILMIWPLLRLVTNSAHPVFVVSSESMEPAFYRGDIILLWNRQQEIQVGDIPVVWFSGRPLPMVHRAVEVHQIVSDSGYSSGRQLILTKGDNNEVDDRVMYPLGREFVFREVIGLVRGYIPYLGWLSLLRSSFSEHSASR
ncbi:putative signal peptidase I [Amniculicola lignicola CBS 123094]|uniref:Signal peptidase complex catalytic subunit SEC11 n=1 Tax=Amniculicola lignicola CBS 123094 TaxID=1392246 RepID=A0A6A5W4R8_9PLEO|nr:putative signal peptidase I [Amniculicola lignicola CBS 123094]